MASNHVHLDDHHAGQQSNMFARPELNAFDNLFSNAHADQTFDAGAWNFEQQGAPPQQWQQQPHQQPMPATFDSSGAFYGGRDFSNSPAPYGGQTFAHQQQFQSNNLDPALMSTATAEHPNFNNTNMRMYANSAAQANTIAPQALRQASYSSSTPPVADFQQNQQRQNNASQQQTLASTPPAAAPAYIPAPPAKYPDAPAGKPSGKFYIIDANELAANTNSVRLHEFLYIGNDAVEMPIMKSSLPQYQARKSRNELRKLAANDERLRAKIAKASKKAKTPAAKVARTRPVSYGSPSSVKDEISDSSSETETSEDDSDYESSDDETPEPSPLPSTRPVEALPAMRYDTIKATWRPRNLPVTADEIRAALKDYWDILQAVRNRWKEDSAALKQAQEKNSRDIELLKGRVKDQRSLMEMALKSALEHGHPDVIRVLGGNAPLLFLAYQFLADRIRENEYNDSFSKAIIELLSRSENITMEHIERTKLNTALKRYLNRGDDRTKPQAEKILERAQTNSKKSGAATTNGASEKKVEVKKEAEASKEPGARPQPPVVAGVKRPRPGDSSAQQPAKKTSSAAAPSSTATAGVKTAASGLKKPGATTTTGSANGAASAATKPKMVSKPNMFAGLQSASKRSNATVQKPTAGTTAAPKKPAAPAPAAPRFSFAETMANLTKPKEQQPASKPEENRPPETEEEKAKRLRKEERRKLRVKWADNGIGNKDQLESVRLFTHDPEEELGHDAAMVRDVADVGGEGRMFKQHKDMMDLDDDDDRPSEEDFRPWRTPSLVDFSTVPESERERNYEPYGGGTLPVDSAEKAVQEQHEANTLLVFYPSPGDIPLCPREPPEDEQQPHTDAKAPMSIGVPPDDSPYTRRAPRYDPTPQPAAPADIPMPDLSSIMSILSRTQQQQAPTPPQPPQLPQPAPQTSELEKTFSMFMPQQQQPPPQVSQPQAPAPAAPAVDIQAILASLNNLNGQSQQAPQPPQPPQQAPPAPFPSMNANPGGGSGFDLAAILQSVGNGGAPPAVPAFGMPLPNQQAQQQHPHQPLPSQSEMFQEERSKRQRGNDDHGGERGWGSNRRNKKWKNKNNPDYQPPQFVVPCKFWKEGKCMKGDKCPVHSSSPASTKPPTATASPPPTAPTAPKSMTSLPQGGGGGKKKKRKKGKRYMDRDANGGDLGAGIMDD
ncbi:Zinc finger CCCH-type protein [Lasiodiplodia theobromae]|uniref:Zinc finger CCCH-type protein n=1 Tax=Lasiodiplodia theobromae TaxID=45133 RepID=UPI0015C31D2A|nr:Zinc finger CCCH-type protein [Lasiodiplodia theobromae]KAF4534736.1 Zinc finger CCCH-type protein [Lasiodiplodia theobromae]